MRTAEMLINDLEKLRRELIWGRGTREQLDIVNAARDYVDRDVEPITPEGLEARGFERCASLWKRRVKDSVISELYWAKAAGMMAETHDCDQSAVPGCRTLAEVDALIRMLEGGT